MTTDVIIPKHFAKPICEAAFDGKNECGAWALFSTSSISRDPWSGNPRKKFILRKLLPLKRADIESSSPVHLTVRTDTFMRVLKDAAEHDLTPGFLHGHPSGCNDFSTADDNNEHNLLLAAQKRINPSSNLISLLALSNGTLRARRWQMTDDAEQCVVSVTGSRYQRFDSSDSITNTILDRQALLFGHAFNQMLCTLRVLVVGVGGTGSPLATMLARAGVGQVALIDPDTVERTNLHRLHGVGANQIGQPKSQALAAYIRSLGLGTRVVDIQGNIVDEQHRDLLKAADIIFCATDDHAGRMLLNRYAYFYETPVIDLGLGIIKRIGSRPWDITGRVTLVYPGAPCLFCRNLIDSRIASEEALHHRFPDQYESQQNEGYIRGVGDPEPAFISMTTSVACMAIDEFTQMLSAYRGKERVITQRLRRFQIPDDRISSPESKYKCRICAHCDVWGKGDVEPFLDRVS